MSISACLSSKSYRRPASKVMPVVVFVVIFTMFGGCWWLSKRHKRTEIRLQTSITAEQVAIRLQEYLAARFAAVETMQLAWQHGHISDRDEFFEHVDEILGTFSGFQAINWTDAEGYIRWVAPEIGNGPAQDALLRAHPVAGPVLDEVDRTGRPAATRPTQLIQGGRGFAAYFPITVEGRSFGYLNAVFRLQPLVTDCFGDDVAANFHYGVRDGGDEVYRTPSAYDDRAAVFEATCPVRVLDRTWQLSMVPREHVLAAHGDPAGASILLMGFLLAFALAWEWRRLGHSRRSLHTRTAELQAIYQAYPDLQFRIAADGTILDCQASVHSKLYVPREQFLGRRMQDVLPADAGARFAEAFARVADCGELVRVEYVLPFDGDDEVFEARIVPLRADEMIVIAREITEQKRSERRQKLMMDELDHRVKNSLASVLALHEQTLASVDSLAEYRDRFTGRLVALARAHEALARTRWNGLRLSRLLEDSLGAHTDDGRRLRLRGEDLMLKAGVSSALSLVAHELTMNAVKHGALSVPHGRIDIAWRREAATGMLHLTWTELDGPAVHAPDSTGLGTSIIRGLIEFQLGGSVRLDFRSDGLVADLSIPLSRELSGSASRGHVVTAAAA